MTRTESEHSGSSAYRGRSSRLSRISRCKKKVGAFRRAADTRRQHASARAPEVCRCAAASSLHCSDQGPISSTCSFYLPISTRLSDRQRATTAVHNIRRAHALIKGSLSPAQRQKKTFTALHGRGTKSLRASRINSHPKPVLLDTPRYMTTTRLRTFDAGLGGKREPVRRGWSVRAVCVAPNKQQQAAGVQRMGSPQSGGVTSSHIHYDDAIFSSVVRDLVIGRYVTRKLQQYQCCCTASGKQYGEISPLHVHLPSSPRSKPKQAIASVLRAAFCFEPTGRVRIHLFLEH